VGHDDTLCARQLNRATLARQHLLARVSIPAEELIAHLVGLQAQEPRDPYVALWSRLSEFDVAELEQSLLERRVVRRSPGCGAWTPLATARGR
jgi:hypothetical protein